MKEMTTAEFAKANLAALEEPVSVRRYTKVVGTYYPDGYAPAAAPAPLQAALESIPDFMPETVAPSSTKATAKIIEDLTEEVRRLKKELAARPPTPITDGLPESWRPQPVAVAKIRAGDPFAGLAKQDHEFFERKLGTKKK